MAGMSSKRLAASMGATKLVMDNREADRIKALHDSHASPDKVNQIRLLTAKIVNEEILPNENRLWRSRQDTDVTDKERQEARELRKSIQEKVKQAGLWVPHLPEEYGGCGLSFLEHAYMNEVLAYAIGAAKLFGVVAPNSGNQKILLK